MSGRLRCVLASLLFSMSCGALAQGTFSAAYNDLAYTLVDRDPNDGITPWATFELVEVSATATVYDAALNMVDTCSITSMGGCSARGGNGEASVWFDGTGSGARGQWSESGAGVVRTETRAVFNYSFSPRTDFAFILDTSLRENMLEGDIGGAYLFFYFNAEEGWFRTHQEDVPGDRIISIDIRSLDEPVIGQVRAYTDMRAEHVPPVPEPSTWAMLSAGLFLCVGTAAGGRRIRDARRAALIPVAAP